jgi:osmotically-inducible protein OsmY
MRNLTLGAAVGAVLAWFFDPRSGRRRRHTARDRVFAFVRRRAREAERARRGAAAKAYGLKQKAAHAHEEPKEYDDATLTQKVESELFRTADVPKGKINVNAENGVVVLRGEVDSWEMVDRLVEQARNTQGVRDVENLLHLPGQPAPMHH